MKRTLVSSLRGRIMLGIAASTFFLITTVAVFYFGFYDSLSEQMDSVYQEYTLELNEQLLSSMVDIEVAVRSLSYNQNVQSFLFSLNPVECILLRSDTDDLMQFFCKNDVIQNIYIKSHNGRARHYNYDLRPPLTEAIDMLADAVDIYSFEPVYLTIDDKYKQDYPSSFIYVAPIYNTLPQEKMASRVNSGICAVLCDMSKIVNWVERDGPAAQILTAMIYEGTVVSSNRPLTARERTELCTPREGFEMIRLDTRKYIINSIELSNRWFFSYILPDSYLLRHSYKTRAIGFTITALSGVLIIFFLQFILVSVGKSTKSIIDELNKLDTYESSKRINPIGPKEFKTIICEINNMLERMQRFYSNQENLKTKVYDAMLAQNAAEMAAYRSQINPHFLFNTLECIRSMATVYDADPIEEMVHALSELFRYSLYSGSIVTFNQELSHVQNYVSVMQQRYPGRIILRFRASVKSRTKPTLAMVLQPIVENSIKHGFKNEKTLNILIQGDTDKNGILHVMVADNGAGISKEKLLHIQQSIDEFNYVGISDPSKSVGLENIFRRLKLISKGKCKFEITSREGYYTVVKYEIPDHIAIDK